MKKHYTLDISTHILTKRMTKRCRKLFMQVWYFNSHPHEEDDGELDEEEPKKETFQLTSSRRGWHCDLVDRIAVNIISTHILTKRMTGTMSLLAQLRDISTHILTKRMTLSPSAMLFSITFQLTSSRRGWHLLEEAYVTIAHFNSHPHEEDDMTQTVQSSNYRYFNSHPHEEDDQLTNTTNRTGQLISTHILTKRMT